MKISALLREAPKGPTLSLDKDLMQRAMLKFPGYDSQQALSLYLADKAEQQKKTDAAQNNVINTQQNAIKSIGQELQDYEAQAQETDREVERLKQLSGALTAGSADRQQKAKVSADELEKLQKELDALKSKPGMDSEKFKQLEAQINSMASNPSADDKDINRIQQLLSSVQKKQTVGDDQYNALVKQLQDTQDSLDAKEARFKKYIQRTGEETRTSAQASAEEMKKYADIVDNYKKKIDNFDEFMQSEKDNILNLRGEIQQMADEIASNINFVKPSLRQNSASAAQNAISNAQATSQAATSTKPPAFDPELFGDEDDEEQQKDPTNYRYESINEEANMAVRPAFDYSHDPEKAEWMAKYLPMMVRMFKKKYAVELSKKVGYTDHQIAYTIEDNIDFLFKHDENPISKQTMNDFMVFVKTNLFRQPPESSTLHMRQDDLFSESLDKTYSRMLDKLIGLPYI
jgi:chromosome segregation ATPase